MIRTLNKHSRNRRFESHIGTYWMTAKAIATVLLRDGWDVFYPSRQTLEQVANGDQNEIAKALGSHFTFVFMRLQQDGNIPLYPTLIVLSDNPNSSRDDAMDLLASHIDVTAEDIEIVCSNFFKDDDEARMSDIFDEIRVDVTPGTGRNDETVDVREFTIADNGTVRELSISAMLEALGANDNADYDIVFSKLKITSPGLVPFNWQDPKVNALTKKLPKFGLTSDGTVTVSREMSLKDMISVVTLQLREWCHPRNHAENMWSRLWESVAVDYMCERPDENLDFNPMTRDDYGMSDGDIDYDSLYDAVTGESKRRTAKRRFEKYSLVFGKNELRKLRPALKTRANERIMDTNSTVSDIKHVMLDFLNSSVIMEDFFGFKIPFNMCAKVDIETKSHNYILFGSYAYTNGKSDEELLCIRVSVHGNHVSLFDVYEDYQISEDTQTPAADLKDYLNGKKSLLKKAAQETHRYCSKYRTKRVRNESIVAMASDELADALIASFERNKKRMNVKPRYSCKVKILSQYAMKISIRGYLDFHLTVGSAVSERIELRYSDTGQVVGTYNGDDFDTLSDLADSIILDIFHTM